MDFKITAEWLQAMVDDVPEPSGLITPNERAELERWKAEQLQSAAQNSNGNGTGKEKLCEPEPVALAGR